MPGPRSATVMYPVPGELVTVTVTGEPGGVCRTALPMRLSMTWRNLPSSAHAMTGSLASSVMVRSGCAIRAALTAAAATLATSTGRGDELPHPVLGADRAGLSVLTGLVCGLNATQHCVERGGEPADLGPAGRMIDALRQVACGDRRGGSLDPAQRPEASAHKRQADAR